MSTNPFVYSDVTHFAQQRRLLWKLLLDIPEISAVFSINNLLGGIPVLVKKALTGSQLEQEHSQALSKLKTKFSLLWLNGRLYRM